jgi:hypothetical protein
MEMPVEGENIAGVKSARQADQASVSDRRRQVAIFAIMPIRDFQGDKELSTVNRG